MDKTVNYKNLVKDILSRHLEIANNQPTPEMEELLITDEDKGIYVWQALGWGKKKRHNYQRVWARVRDGKIYIEEDWTEEGIASELLENGVPKEDIVLAFHQPEMRKLTDFAIA